MWMTLDRAPYLVKITVPPRRRPTHRWPTVAVRARSTPTASRPIGPRRAAAARRDVARGGRDRALRHDRPRPRSGCALPDLAPGEHVVRLTVTSSAGSASSRPLTIGRTDRARAHREPGADREPDPDHDPRAHAGRHAARVGRRRGQERRGGGAERHRELPRPAVDDLHQAHGHGDAPARRGARHRPPARSASPRRWTARRRRAAFNGGKFSVTQTATGMTELALAGPLDCSARGAGDDLRAKRRKRRSARCGARTAAARSARAATAASPRCAGPNGGPRTPARARPSTCARARCRCGRGAAAARSSFAPVNDCSRRARDDPAGQGHRSRSSR